MSEPSQSERARALLAWYREMGVDEAVTDAPLDWAEARFGAQATPPADQQPKAIRAAPAALTRPRHDAPARPVRSGGDLSHIGTLEALEAEVAAFEGCGLKRTAKSL